MDKQDKIKILALVGVLVMFGSMIAPQLIGNLGNTDNTVGTAVYGLAVINGTIRTYDPILFASSEYNETDFDSVKDDDGFRNLRKITEGWVLETVTRDDVYPIAETLKRNGVVSATVANIALPATVEVSLQNGSIIEAESRGGVVRVVMEPFLEEDSEVSVQFVGIVYDNVLVNTTNSALLADTLKEEVNASVEELSYILYSYEIPWKLRNKFDTSNISGEASIEANNIIYFNRELSVNEVMQFKLLPYIEYIDTGSAGVSPSFEDNETIASDFGEVGYVLPPSTLRIISNESVVLPYEGSSLRSYRILLPDYIGGYSLEDRVQYIETEATYETGDSVPVVVEGMAIGNRIVSVASVLPS